MMTQRRLKKFWFHKCFTSKQGLGFTLIELLVVISVVSLLVSILLPTLAKSRLAAQNVQCLSSLRQIGIGTTVYADENEGYFPHGFDVDLDGDGEANGWPTQVMAAYLQTRQNVASDIWCPTETTAPVGGIFPLFLIPVVTDPSTRNYGMNDFGTANAFGFHHVRQDDLARASSVRIFADTYPSVWFGNVDSAWAWSYFGPRVDQVDMIDYRHDGRANVGFADGHAGTPEVEVVVTSVMEEPAFPAVDLSDRQNYEYTWYSKLPGSPLSN